MKFVSDCLTGKDNVTYDAGRVIGVLGALMYVLFWVVQAAAPGAFYGLRGRLRARARDGVAGDGRGARAQGAYGARQRK